MKRGVFLIFVVPFLFFNVSAIEFLFNGSGTQFGNITLSSSWPVSFIFNVTGSSYNGSYPSNISIDIGNDGIIDWDYYSYLSYEPVYADEIEYASSNLSSVDGLYLTNLSNGT